MCLNYHLSTFAEAIAKPVAARPEHTTTTCHCEGVARSNLLLVCCSSFEIASLTVFVRNDGWKNCCGVRGARPNQKI